MKGGVVCERIPVRRSGQKERENEWRCEYRTGAAPGGRESAHHAFLILFPE